MVLFYFLLSFFTVFYCLFYFTLSHFFQLVKSTNDDKEYGSEDDGIYADNIRK